MGEVIDFAQARIRLRSNIKDPVLIQDMLDNAYDPCDPEDVEGYWMQRDLIFKLEEGLKYEFTQDYIYEPDLSAFFTDDNK